MLKITICPTETEQTQKLTLSPEQGRELVPSLVKMFKMSASKNLATAENAELKEFLDSFDDVLCDCDGVLFLSDTPIEGAANAVERLKSLGKQIQYVSNNCSRPRAKFTAFVQRFGMDVKEEDVILPTNAIIDYLKSTNFDKKVFLLSCNSMRSEFRDAGFTVAETGPTEIEETPAGVMQALSIDREVGAVIVDNDFNLNYMKLQRALLHIRNPEVYFIAGGSDRLLPIGKSVTVMGAAFFQEALEECSGRTPLRFGKPGKNLNMYVNKKYNINPSRTLFIGDTFSDMEFARDGGYQKLMVLTGVAKEKDLLNCEDAELMPKYYLNSLGDLTALLDKLSQSSL